jgi:hypothetical protein
MFQTTNQRFYGEYGELNYNNNVIIIEHTKHTITILYG